MRDVVQTLGGLMALIIMLTLPIGLLELIWCETITEEIWQLFGSSIILFWVCYFVDKVLLNNEDND